MWAYDLSGRTIRILNTSCSSSSSVPKRFYSLTVADTDWKKGSAYLGMEFGTSKSLSGLTDREVTIYAGYYNSMDELTKAGAADITNRVWRRSGTGGYLGAYGDSQKYPGFTMVLRKNGKTAMVYPFYVRFSSGGASLSYDVWLYQEETNEDGDLLRKRVAQYNSKASSKASDEGAFVYMATDSTVDPEGKVRHEVA